MRSSVLGIALLLLSLLAASCMRIGVRRLRVEFRQGDVVVLATYYSDPDANRAEDVRDYLAQSPAQVSRNDYAIVPAEDDPLRATLEGPVRIEVRHVDRVLAAVDLEGVTLVRDDERETRWYLPPQEMARIQR